MHDTAPQTADGGYSGRPRWYWSAAVPNDEAWTRRDQRLVAPCRVIPHAAAIAAVRRASPSSPPPAATCSAVSFAVLFAASSTSGNICCLARLVNICCPRGRPAPGDETLVRS